MNLKKDRDPYRLSNPQKVPLQNFYTHLKNHGLECTSGQISDANKLIAKYGNSTNHTDLRKYLCGLFATNEQEQHNFNKVFDTCFPPIVPPPPPTPWIRYVVGLLIIASASVYFLKDYILPAGEDVADRNTCPQHSVRILSNPDGPLSLGSTSTFTAQVDGAKPDTLLWTVNGVSIAGGESFSYTYVENGDYSIQVKSVFDSINSPCNGSHLVATTIASDDESVPINVRISPVFDSYIMVTYPIRTGVLIITFFALFFWLTIRQALQPPKPQETLKKTQNRPPEFMESIMSKGVKPPFIVPFKNQNRLISIESEVNTISRIMQSRKETESSYLHIAKTIDKSVKSGGLFQPVFTPRTIQSEYLFLLNVDRRNSIYVKLFELLVSHLSERNVLVNSYYFDKSINKCYRTKGGSTFTLDELTKRYADSTLILVGNGYQLLSSYYPVPDPKLERTIKTWDKRALLTPVSAADWTQKERSSLESILPVFPIDIPGLLLFAESLITSKDTTEKNTYREVKNQVYPVNTIDFEKIEDLKKYCGNASWAGAPDSANLLFQWIASLALYPKIRWELLVSNGAAILEKHECSNQLNFTNLLLLVRIKWIADGQFPDHTRLELLKCLSIEHEEIGRNNILESLKKISLNDLPKDSLAFEEKEVQVITNEFCLFAFDPHKYADFNDSKDKFLALYANKKVVDTPIKIYLENKQEKWKNPITESSAQKKVELEPTEDEKTVKYEKRDAEARRKILNSKLESAPFAALTTFVTLALLFLFVNQIEPVVIASPQVSQVLFEVVNEEQVPVPDELFISIDSVQQAMTAQVSSSLKTTEPTSIRIGTPDRTYLDSSFVARYEKYIVNIEEVQDNGTRLVFFVNETCSDQYAKYVQQIQNFTDSTWSISRSSIDRNNTECFSGIAFGPNVGNGKLLVINDVFSEMGVELRPGNPPRTPLANEILVYPFEEEEETPPNQTTNSSMKTRQQITLENAAYDSLIRITNKANLVMAELQVVRTQFSELIKTISADDPDLKELLDFEKVLVETVGSLEDSTNYFSKPAASLSHEETIAYYRTQKDSLSMITYRADLVIENAKAMIAIFKAKSENADSSEQLEGSIQETSEQNQPPIEIQYDIKDNLNLTNSEINDIVNRHNFWRAQVGIGPLEWSDELAQYAAEWAEQLKKRSKKNCAFEHRPGNEFGENLFLGTTNFYNAADVINTWADERRDYDYDKNECVSGKVCGHYTQIVWEDTKRVGCAKITCNGNDIWVCNYDPPGNLEGERPYVKQAEETEDNDQNNIEPVSSVSKIFGRTYKSTEPQKGEISNENNPADFVIKDFYTTRQITSGEDLKQNSFPNGVSVYARIIVDVNSFSTVSISWKTLEGEEIRSRIMKLEPGTTKFHDYKSKFPSKGDYIVEVIDIDTEAVLARTSFRIE